MKSKWPDPVPHEGSEDEAACEDDPEGFFEDWVEHLEDEDEQEAEAGELLQACDAHMEVKDQIAHLQAELAEQAPPDAEEELVTASVETVSIENLCVTDLFMQIRQLPLSEESLVVLLQQRMAEVRPLDEWLQTSSSPGKGAQRCWRQEQKVVRGDNEWNRVQHELCLARQASLLTSGQRTSRLAAWPDKQC